MCGGVSSLYLLVRCSARIVEYMLSVGADVNYHPQATAKASPFQISVDKGSEPGFWWDVEVGGGLAFVVDFSSF